MVYARFTGFLQSQTDRVVNAVGSIPAPTDYTSQLTAVVEKLDALANKSAVDLTTIESTLSTISDKLDNTASDVNNTIINITNDNDYFSVFYITDGDGNTQSVTDCRCFDRIPVSCCRSCTALCSLTLSAALTVISAIWRTSSPVRSLLLRRRP